jgi:hypothetical protein
MGNMDDKEFVVGIVQQIVTVLNQSFAGLLLRYADHYVFH